MAEDNEQGQTVDLSALGSFDFAPSWATGDKVIAKSGHGFRDRDEDRPSRDDDQGYRRFDGPKRDRPPRRDDHGRKPFSRDGRDRSQFGRDGRDRPQFGRDRDAGRHGQGRREFIKPLDAEVRVLPAQRELEGIIRKIQKGFVAYPLKQIALFFLDHPEACHVKVTPKDPEMRFHVCKACGCSFFTEEALEAHLLGAHLGDYYVSEETEVSPPSGQFGCVVKCGITGELLGPPNLHGYNSAVREMAQKLGMDENAYRARLVTVRDSESIEAWRNGATKKTLYRLKAAVEAAKATKSVQIEAAEPSPEAPAAESPAESPAKEEAVAEPPQVPALEREQAEASFRRDIMPQLRSLSKSSDMRLDLALKSSDLPYLFAVRDTIVRERRFPASLFFALRGAFHRRKLSLFRANDPRGQEFVYAANPAPLDTDHAIPELVAVVKYVEDHPLCSVGDLPSDMKGHLGWLVEKGHIVRYFNGLLALPEKHPKFRNQPPQKGGADVAQKDVGNDAAMRQDESSPEVDKGETVPEAPPQDEGTAAAPAAQEMNVEEESKKEEVANEAADKLAQ